MPQTDRIATRDGTNRHGIDRYGLATNAAATVGVGEGQEISPPGVDGDTVGGRAIAPQISSAR